MNPFHSRERDNRLIAEIRKSLDAIRSSFNEENRALHARVLDSAKTLSVAVNGLVEKVHELEGRIELLEKRRDETTESS